MKIIRSNRTLFKDHQITDENTFNHRRQLIKTLGYIGAGILLTRACSRAGVLVCFDDKQADSQPSFKEIKYQEYKGTKPTLTPEKKVTSHNNFYEFGTQKSDPAQNAYQLTVDPWTLSINGLCDNPYQLGYEDLFNRFALEERIYRLRCVETWSMVIPWIGFPLAALLKTANPKSNAKFIAFETLTRPEEMIGQQSRLVGGGIEYPYVEGLRLDEAMNSLAFLAVGLYGKALPNQNGAPIRLVVPWKYGFKSIKTITNIRFTDQQPPTTWNKSAANEYGFYANVNPNVAHPRWSQAQERVITSGGLFGQKHIKTEMFNGYGEQVAHLYKNMNLRKYF
jgi:sulfoxide reductase catalytic subunit YedY